MERSRKDTLVLYSRFLLCFAGRGLRRVDPRVVRFKRPRRFPKWVMTVQIVVVVLAACVVATAAVLPGEDKRTVSEDGFVEMEQAFTTQVSEVKPTEIDDALPPREKSERKNSRFYDPVYVFLESEVESVTAYPLASPPGIVIDLKGTPEPSIAPEEFVGKDSRIRAVRRRVTSSGIRYVIGLTTPIKRIETLKEGNVVMVFPKS